MADERSNELTRGPQTSTLHLVVIFIVDTPSEGHSGRSGDEETTATRFSQGCHPRLSDSDRHAGACRITRAQQSTAAAVADRPVHHADVRPRRGSTVSEPRLARL